MFLVGKKIFFTQPCLIILTESLQLACEHLLDFYLRKKLNCVSFTDNIVYTYEQQDNMKTFFKRIIRIPEKIGAFIEYFDRCCCSEKKEG